MNSMIIKHARALRDLEECSEYLRQRNPRSALRFLDEAEAAFHRLAAMPGIGTRIETANPAFGELRYFPLPSRFRKYVVFYRPVAHGIEIVRVLHGSRDVPGILAEDFGLAGGADDKVEKGSD